MSPYKRAWDWRTWWDVSGSSPSPTNLQPCLTEQRRATGLLTPGRLPMLHRNRLCTAVSDPTVARKEKDIEQALSVCNLSEKKRYREALKQVEDCERTLDLEVTRRWTPVHVEWMKNQNAEKMWEYLKALEGLEIACVARFLEAQKMNRPDTGAHQRQIIQKNMHERSKAVRVQIVEVNRLAKIVGVKTPLDFESVTKDDLRQLFAILSKLRPKDSVEPTWMLKSCREAVRCFTQSQRAKEELVHLSVEWRRLHIWIWNREHQYRNKIDKELIRSPISSLAKALEREYDSLKLEHRAILRDLKVCQYELVKRTGMSLALSTPKAQPSCIIDSPEHKERNSSEIEYPHDIEKPLASWGFQPKAQEPRIRRKSNDGIS
ncbi:hypothetical protein QFC21_004222 [Naganishia friedmannii]|uniref:Uncharacterized protein n=1 Tax=Naganishia friedmannii TaxID=89922 RepID=A0ACC2VL48_9TREE|nr:hypothetical protein QFC21_004222 [Naganishia friedmannii]